MADFVLKKQETISSQETKKSGATTITIKSKATKKEVVVKPQKIINERIYDEEHGRVYKASFSYIKSKKELLEALEEYLDEQDEVDNLMEDYGWDATKAEDFLYDDSFKPRNVYTAIYYNISNGEYVIEDIKYSQKKIQRHNDGLSIEEKDEENDESVDSTTHLSASETEESEQRDAMTKIERGESAEDIISETEKNKWKKRIEENNKKIPRRYRKTKNKKGVSRGKVKYRLNALSPKEYIDEYYSGGKERNGGEWVPYKYSAATGLQHHKPGSQADIDSRNRYNKIRSELRAKDRENYSIIKQNFQHMKTLVVVKASKKLEELARRAGLSTQFSSSPYIAMPTLKTPASVAVTEWAGTKIYTPLLNPLQEEARIQLQREKTKKLLERRAKKPYHPPIDMNKNLGDYKLPSRQNLVKLGVTLEFYPCLVAATYFQILVSLTPIDEEYEYEKSEVRDNRREIIRRINSLEKGLARKTKDSTYQKLTDIYGSVLDDYKGLTNQLEVKVVTKHIKHKIDKDIVRADWILHFRGHEFKAFSSNRSSGQIEFEEDWFVSTGDLESIRRIANVIYQTVKDSDDLSTNWDCENINPRKDMLEYGGYKYSTKNDAGMLTRRIGTSPKYHFEHGVMASGYVYQAPAGFERITKIYYLKLLHANRGFATKFINTCSTDKYHNLQTKKQFTDLNNKMFKKLKNINPHLGE